MTTVPYVPGYPDGVRSVMGNGQKDVTRQYKWRIPRANTRIRSHSVGVDRFTVLALLGFCLVADGGALFLCGWLFRGAA